MNTEASGIRIFADADACPVKDEIFRVATRCGVKVVVVPNVLGRLLELDLNAYLLSKKFEASHPEHLLTRFREAAQAPVI